MIVSCDECCRVFHEGDLCACVQCGCRYCPDCLIDDHCIECAQEWIEDGLRDAFHCRYVSSGDTDIPLDCNSYTKLLDWVYKRYPTKELFRYEDFDDLVERWLSELEKVSLPENKEGIAGRVEWVVV